jgi:hypothetical protein
MFSIGPVDIEVSVTGAVAGPNGDPSIPINHRGVMHVVAISNQLTVPIDVEVDGSLGNNLLVFASGRTWTKLLQPLPAYVRAQPPPPSKTNEPLIRPVNSGTGSEAVYCSHIRWCHNGAVNLGQRLYPGQGSRNHVTVTVPP